VGSNPTPSAKLQIFLYFQQWFVPGLVFTHDPAPPPDCAIWDRHHADRNAYASTAFEHQVPLARRDALRAGIGQVLEAYTVSHRVNVLVMGAYGHSRWREFILGSATKSLLSKPPLPILFSH
jgi:hypothetical protein